MPAIRPHKPSTYSQLRKLARGISHELKRRDSFYYGDDGSDAARYAFFAFAVVALILFIFFTCVVNKRRLRTGRSPIISSYLAPPNYQQSQSQYNANTTGGANLPTYTPNANPSQDVGYYDKNGNFIPAIKDSQGNVLNPNPDLVNNSTINNTGVELSTDIPTAHTQPPNIYEPQSTNDMTYTRPNGPPPTQTYNTSPIQMGTSSSNMNELDDDPELPPYEAPPLPEKSHYRA
ncbi:uncharacterized protein C5L36_0A00640 [Pichia kudriavzevii]|uniref:Protein RCR2 n=1 Tax=Pichia kudriavzevii TaxID=4909 RepID=A0A2U9QWQ8_PICKU|nr:uncharacterized protein C5L36_0A00640 [Pichia kudriavzevii]AWU73452.1 hypothetical protein C5L36_0A00640 [Pichia kudriavzevii]